MVAEDDSGSGTGRPFSKLAVGALVLAVLSLMPFGPFPLMAGFAAFYGCAALARIRRSDGASRGRGFAIAGLVISCFTIVIWVSEFTASLSPSWVNAEAQLASCKRNLKHIGIACRLYAADYGGAFPDSLNQLYPDYVSALETFVCPATDTEPGDPRSVDAWSDYDLFPDLTEHDDWHLTLARCGMDNHGTECEVDLLIDGHVQQNWAVLHGVHPSWWRKLVGSRSPDR